VGGASFFGADGASFLGEYLQSGARCVTHWADGVCLVHVAQDEQASFKQAAGTHEGVVVVS